MDFTLPEIGEGVYEAELTAWLVEPGDAVKRGQPLLEVMTDKATMEVPAPFAGTITALHAPSRASRSRSGDLVLTYEARHRSGSRRQGARHGRQGDKEPSWPRRQSIWTAVAASPSVSPRLPEVRCKAAPRCAPMARKLGIDLARLHGSGPDGRILIDDLTAACRSRPAPKPAPAEPARLRHARARGSSCRGCAARSPSTWSRPSGPFRITATSMNATSPIWSACATACASRSPAAASS